MRLFGLIGHPLTHSFSKKYFSEKFHREKISDCSYENFPIVSIEEFPALLSDHPHLTGLNVTIPYKEEILSFLDEINETAEEIGAVNTIKIKEGITVGFNTDVYGFIQSLSPHLENMITSALICGTGGSSKAVAYGLKKMGINFQFLSRNPEGDDEISYNDLDEWMMKSNKLIVNTTPLGMFPDVDDCPPLPYEYLTPSHFLFDLIYNPEETLFLQKGKEHRARVKNGLEMLQLQAEKSWEIWNS